MGARGVVMAPAMTVAAPPVVQTPFVESPLVATPYPNVYEYPVNSVVPVPATEAPALSSTGALVGLALVAGVAYLALS